MVDRIEKQSGDPLSIDTNPCEEKKQTSPTDSKISSLSKSTSLSDASLDLKNTVAKEIGPANSPERPKGTLRAHNAAADKQILRLELADHRDEKSAAAEQVEEHTEAQNRAEIDQVKEHYAEHYEESSGGNVSADSL